MVGREESKGKVESPSDPGDQRTRKGSSGLVRIRHSGKKTVRVADWKPTEVLCSKKKNQSAGIKKFYLHGDDRGTRDQKKVLPGSNNAFSIKVSRRGREGVRIKLVRPTLGK